MPNLLFSLHLFCITNSFDCKIHQAYYPKKARELIYFGEPFGAAEALEWGMLWRVVLEAQVLPEAIGLARRIADLPPRPVKDLKRILTQALRASLEETMAAETAATVQGFVDPESAKRVAERLTP